MTVGLSLTKSVLIPLAKIILLSFRLSATDAAIQKKIDVSGTTALIIPNKEMEDIIKLVESLEESGILIKGISEMMKNEAKRQKGGFLPLLLGILTASILGNTLSEKRVIRPGKAYTIQYNDTLDKIRVIPC